MNSSTKEILWAIGCLILAAIAAYRGHELAAGVSTVCAWVSVTASKILSEIEAEKVLECEVSLSAANGRGNG